MAAMRSSHAPSRPVRSGVIALLLVWMVQFGAQLCAQHCAPMTAWAGAPTADADRPASGAAYGIAGTAADDSVPDRLAERGATPGPASGEPSVSGEPARAGADPPSAVAVALAGDAVRSLPGVALECPLADVCDLGQTALLPFDQRPVARIAAVDGPSAPPVRAARFERAPEERPPTA